MSAEDREREQVRLIWAYLTAYHSPQAELDRKRQKQRVYQQRWYQRRKAAKAAA